ncbi:MAG: NUDIX domain-containing protein [Patescibacteria group bacterium]|jgi:ADP-ribose pyrophosphatase YjhB (NUDIX family)
MFEIDFRFCPACRGEFKKEGVNFLRCTQCDLRYYVNPHPCNAVIIENSKKEIMLIERKIDPKKGMLDLPGGFVDLNESFEDSVTREIKEELQVVITDLKYFGSYYDLYGYGQITYHTLCCVFLGSIGEQQPIPTDDVAAIQYFPKDRIPFDKLAFDGLRQAIGDYLHK